MTTGGNWWRANEIVIRHLTRLTETRYRSRDKAGRRHDRTRSVRKASTEPLTTGRRPDMSFPISPGTGDEHHKAGVGPTGRMRQNQSFSRSFLRTRRASGRRTSARPLTAGRPYRIAFPASSPAVSHAAMPPSMCGRWRVRGGLHCHRRALVESAVEDDHLAGHCELIKIHRESTPTRER
jgi:hypothetical protein